MRLSDADIGDQIVIWLDKNGLVAWGAVTGKTKLRATVIAKNDVIILAWKKYEPAAPPQFSGHETPIESYWAKKGFIVARPYNTGVECLSGNICINDCCK